MHVALELASAVTGLEPVDLVFSVIDAIALPPMEGPMASRAHVVHHIPGRVRLRIPTKRRDHRYFAEMKKRLDACPASTSVEVNPSSASVLIRYAGSLPALLAEAAAAGLFELAEVSDDLPFLPPVAEQLIERLGDLDHQIVRSTGGIVNGRSVVLAGLLLAAGVQMLRGQLLGPAVPLLWYAARSLGGILPGDSKPPPPTREPKLVAESGA